MTTLTIQIPDGETKRFTDLVKKVKGEILASGQTAINMHAAGDLEKSLPYLCERDHTPNPETLKAIEEVKAGKGKRFKTAEALFASIK